jgi:uridine kinase
MSEAAILSHDNYYKHRPELSDHERDKINFDHPDSLETDLMVSHLEQLLRGEVNRFLCVCVRARVRACARA